jgi:hypothetical protein
MVEEEVDSNPPQGLGPRVSGGETPPGPWTSPTLPEGQEDQEYGAPVG